MTTVTIPNTISRAGAAKRAADGRAPFIAWALARHVLFAERARAERNRHGGTAFARHLATMARLYLAEYRRRLATA